jgi:CMP-N,N'-diacetyllegionaminic acid synthase
MLFGKQQISRFALPIKMNILCFIPARSGSKGILKKNIKPMLGKPLIAWSIEQATKSKYINKVLVSTDDPEYADIAKKYGAEVPFLRPKELATDTSPTINAIEHAVNWLKGHGEEFDLLVLLEPTSPLRETVDIDNAIGALLANKSARAIVSVAKLESCHPEFNVVLNEEGFISKIDGGHDFGVLRRQDLKDIYFFDGSLYISYVNTLLEKRTFYHEKTLGFQVPKYKSYEIDDLSDFILIESLLKAKLDGRL